MIIKQKTTLSACLILMLYGLALRPAQAADPLPSWNSGNAKQAIIGFVAAVTDKSNPQYVRPEERIAVFDSDGTLWPEKPIIFQLAFILDRIRLLSKEHPEWKPEQPFKAVIENDMQYLATITERELMLLLAASHSGTTPNQFFQRVNDWLATASHPRFRALYKQLTYQPMLELLGYLRSAGFKTYICSGSGSDFMRAFSEELYGIPREQVIGSPPEYDFVETPEGPFILRQSKISTLNQKEQKPINIQHYVGRRPVIAVGNSDADLQMLQFADNRRDPALVVLLRHDDAAREYAYDQDTAMLRKAAQERGWCAVSMKKEFKKVFSFEK